MWLATGGERVSDGGSAAFAGLLTTLTLTMTGCCVYRHGCITCDALAGGPGDSGHDAAGQEAGSTVHSFELGVFVFPKRAMAAILAILMVGGCSSGGSPADAREYSLAAGSNRMSYVVTQYLDAAGVAAKEDLRLRYVTSATASNTNLMAGLLSGEFDFAIPGAQTALDAVAKGVPIQVVAGIANSTNVLIIRSDVASRLDVAPDASPAEKVAALRGLKIGTGPAGSSPYDRFRTMVRTAAIDPDRDLTMLGVTDSSALAAGLRSGTYDAVWVAIGDSEPLIVDGTATMWLSLPRGDFPAHP
jgi:NitT/TauT family transport system substrate-binding protein